MTAQNYVISHFLKICIYNTEMPKVWLFLFLFFVCVCVYLIEYVFINLYTKIVCKWSFCGMMHHSVNFRLICKNHLTSLTIIYLSTRNKDTSKRDNWIMNYNM